MRNLVNVIKEKSLKKEFISDMLVILSFFITFFTTLSINIYIAFYLLAICLFVFSYLINKDGR